MDNDFAAVIQNREVGRTEDVPHIEQLLRQLLDCLSQPTALQHLSLEDETTPQIIFDACIGEARYILTRCAPPPLTLQATLSPREREIARLISRGLPNKAVAAILDISTWTVATHLKRIFSKLSVSSRAEMVARVLEQDLISRGRGQANKS